MSSNQRIKLFSTLDSLKKDKLVRLMATDLSTKIEEIVNTSRENGTCNGHLEQHVNAIRGYGTYKSLYALDTLRFAWVNYYRPHIINIVNN